jgi:transcriptional regulator with XRE-family HTH domain
MWKISHKVRQRIRRLALKALRMARADAGLTISEVAKRAGVSRDTISNAERGHHSLQAATLHKVARALGKAPSDLLAEEERLAPKADSRSSLEPSLFNGLEDERPSRFARAVALVADKWGMDVASTLTNDGKRFGIIEAAIDLSDAVNVSVEDWSALAHQDQVEILTAMGKLREVAERGLKHLEQSAQNRAEEESFNERREQIRQWTEQISA